MALVEFCFQVAAGKKEISLETRKQPPQTTGKHYFLGIHEVSDKLLYSQEAYSIIVSWQKVGRKYWKHLMV